MVRLLVPLLLVGCVDATAHAHADAVKTCFEARQDTIVLDLDGAALVPAYCVRELEAAGAVRQ